MSKFVDFEAVYKAHRKGNYSYRVRSYDVQKEYELNNILSRQQGLTTEERILKEIAEKKDNLIPNLYGYDLPEDCEHWIYWITNEEQEKIMDFKIKYKFSNQEHFVFINEPENQSVKGIKHYHVIVKKKVYKEEGYYGLVTPRTVKFI